MGGVIVGSSGNHFRGVLRAIKGDLGVNCRHLGALIERNIKIWAIIFRVTAMLP